MIIVAGLIVVGGYGVTYWAVCLVKGKNVTLSQMFNPFLNAAQFAGPFSKWPKIPDTQVWPDGKPAADYGKLAQQAGVGAVLGGLGKKRA